MSHRQVKPRVNVSIPSIPMQAKSNMSVKLFIGLFSCYKLADVLGSCYKLNIRVISCTRLGGILNKQYHLEMEGDKWNIDTLKSVLNRWF